MINEWAILCPGPSLNKIYPQNIRCALGNTIFVNSAVLRFPGVPGYWCLLDDEVFKSVTSATSYKRNQAFIQRNTVLWTRDNFGNGAERDAGWTKRTRGCFDSFRKNHFRDITEAVDYGPQKFWRGFSLFAAIALAELNGAKEINVYGADWSGAGYCNRGHENTRTRHIPVRWEEEKEIFNHIRSRLAERGIMLRRYIA